MATTLLKLNTGASVPALGLGTWQSAPDEVRRAVLHALRAGYRHIDCAYVYGNEAEVGEALKEAFAAGVVRREDVFVTTKLWCTWHQRAEAALDVSLERLGLDYVDLYLMHWPCPMEETHGTDFPKHPDGSRILMDAKDWSHVDTWKSMERLPATGKARAIGVSNYSEKYLQELLPAATVVPAVNQVENHPLLPQDALKAFCDARGILVTAYSPLGSTGGPLFKNPTVLRVAERRGVSAGSVLLSYHVTRGNSVLAKSVTPSRIEENMSIVELTAEDMRELHEIQASEGPVRYVFPPFGPTFGFPDKEAPTAA